MAIRIVKVDPNRSSFRRHVIGAWNVLQERYGGSFPLLELQKPENVAALIKKRKLSVYVALDEAGKVVGTGSIVYSKSGKKSNQVDAELGRAAVSEKFGAAGIGKQLVAIRLAEARANARVRRIYSTVRASEPATVHNVIEKGGLTPLGLLPLNYALGRQQSLIFASELRSEAKPPSLMLLPEEHKLLESFIPHGSNVRVVAHHKVAPFKWIKGSVEFYSSTARCAKLKLGGNKLLDREVEKLTEQQKPHVIFIDMRADNTTLKERRSLLNQGFVPTILDVHAPKPVVVYARMVATVHPSDLKLPQSFKSEVAQGLRAIHAAHTNIVRENVAEVEAAFDQYRVA